VADRDQSCSFRCWSHGTLVYQTDRTYSVCLSQPLAGGDQLVADQAPRLPQLAQLAIIGYRAVWDTISIRARFALEARVSDRGGWLGKGKKRRRSGGCGYASYGVTMQAAQEIRVR